ncbi:MAG: DNA primase [Bacteroidetes bacterium]|nr:DNA primase [Bacteroidota bacterium]
MSKIPSHIIDQIMQSSRIEEVIGDFVQLKRAGSNLKGLSPFTDEKTPSFIVSPAKQIFKCFSTGKGGTVVTFLMEKEHFSYPEALRWLANRYNIEIPAETAPTAEEIADKNERDSLFIINEFAKSHFIHNLMETDEGKAVGLTYFEERGFRKDIVEKFQLGYCLNVNDDFTKNALEKGYKLEYLEKVGLTKSKDDRQFDFFRGRVMFPIQSITGRVLGFGGRTLFTDKKIAKYFNSPESIIYNKSEILYGLFFAKGTIVKYEECFLCEGYTDVISMHQAGIENVVSSSGTSLTKEQVKLVKRYTQNLTILYDGDAAGIKASFRGIDLILEEGMNVKVVLFPDGEDPDSFSKKTSSTELEQYIKDHRQDFITFKASILLKENGNDPLKKSELIRDIVQSVSLIPDQITRSVYVQEIARQFEINESIISNELIKIRKNTIARQIQEPEMKEVQVEKQDLIAPTQLEFEEKTDYLHEEELIRLLLRFGTREISVASDDKQEQSTSIIELIINEVLTDDLDFKHPVYNRIFQFFVDGIRENVLYSSSYFKRLEDQEIVTFVSDLESREIELSHNWIHHHGIFTKSESDNLYPTIMNGIYNFKYHKVEERLNEIKKSFKTTELSDEDVLLALSEQMALEKVKKILSEKLGRIILK